MPRFMGTAYPDEKPGAAGVVGDKGMGAAPEAPGLPVGDGGGGEMPQWLREAGDAGFAPPKSPAHCNFEYAPNVEIDPEFDRMAREWMNQAELPARWSAEIVRDYLRRVPQNHQVERAQSALPYSISPPSKETRPWPRHRL